MRITVRHVHDTEPTWQPLHSGPACWIDFESALVSGSALLIPQNEIEDLRQQSEPQLSCETGYEAVRNLRLLRENESRRFSWTPLPERGDYQMTGCVSDIRKNARGTRIQTIDIQIVSQEPLPPYTLTPEDLATLRAAAVSEIDRRQLHAILRFLAMRQSESTCRFTLTGVDLAELASPLTLQEGDWLHFDIVRLAFYDEGY